MLQLLRDGQFLLFALVGVVLVLAITLHEFAHALVADRQGDRTARLAGRLTLNPLKHLDPIGSLALVLAGFGWGKPVPFSPSALRARRFGPAMVALAGPAMNMLLALVAASLFVRTEGRGLGGDFLALTLHFNVLLALFNLIPLPPLDGSRVLSAVLPPSKQHVIYFLDKWGFLILLVLVFFVLRPVLLPIVSTVTGVVLRLVGG